MDHEVDINNYTIQYNIHVYILAYVFPRFSSLSGVITEHVNVVYCTTSE